MHASNSQVMRPGSLTSSSNLFSPGLKLCHQNYIPFQTFPPKLHTSRLKGRFSLVANKILPFHWSVNLSQFSCLLPVASTSLCSRPPTLTLNFNSAAKKFSQFGDCVSEQNYGQFYSCSQYTLLVVNICTILWTISLLCCVFNYFSCLLKLVKVI